MASTTVHISNHTLTPTLTPSHRKKLTRQDTIEGASNNELVIAQTRKWIEDCTGCVQEERSFKEYLQDGTVLCNLIQRIRPGLIKKINRVRSPFAWRENLGFFLDACRQLGLKGSQLFSPEDLYSSSSSPSYKAKIPGRGVNERRLRNVAVNIYWLARIVQDFPDYCGPQLDLDLSLLADLESSLKSQGSKPDLWLDSPVPSPSPPIRERSFTSPAKPSTPHSPLIRSSQEDRKWSPTVRVRKVESVVLQTDRQSYPQIVLYVGGDKQKVKEEEEERLKGRVLHLDPAESEPEEPFSTDHLVESDKCIVSQVTRASERNDIPKGKQTPPENSGSVIEQIEACVIETNVESANPGIIQDLNHNTLQNSRESSLYSPTDSRECDSTTPSSEVSTVIPRDQSSSRCSGSLTGSEDLGGRSEFSETESQFNSPPSRRRLPSQAVFTHENPFSPLSVVHIDTQEDPVGIPSQLSPPRLSNPPGVIAVDQVGLLPLDFRSELFGSSSQESGSVVYYSPRDGDTAFHFSLTNSLPEEFGEFSPRVVKRYSAELNPVTESSAPVLGQISEEPEPGNQPESRQSGSSPRKASKPQDSSTDTTGLQLEGTLDSSTVSEQSSVVSTDSSSSSTIVVSYLQKNVQGGEQISDIVRIATSVSYTNSFSSSDDSFENPTDQPPRKKSKKSDPELIIIPQKTANSTEETNDSSEMAVRTQVLRIYPSQSSSGVPHHSLNTSGPDSPSSHKTSKGRTLYVMPSSGHSKYKAVVKPQPEYEEVDVPIVLLPGEKRLGFSVAGGKDQDTFPHVGSIGGDSPAARSLLRCGDELLSVNGRPLLDTVHSQATRILHDTATRGKIVLRVRRTVGEGPSHQYQDSGPTNSDQKDSDSTLGPAIVSIVPDPKETTEEPPPPPLPPPPSHLAVHHLKTSKAASLDISRVSSDALPHSMHARMVVCKEPTPEVENEDQKEDSTPDFLSDVNSTAVEIGSSVDDFEKLSVTDSHRSMSSEIIEVGSHGDLHGENAESAGKDTSGSVVTRQAKSNVDGFSIVDSVLAVAKRHSQLSSSSKEDSSSPERTPTTVKSSRPASAPTRTGRSVSTSAIRSEGSRTLPSLVSPSELKKFKEKRTSLHERERRRANIAHSTMAALQYSEKQKLKKTDSLPHQFRSSSLSKSEEDEDIDLPVEQGHARMSSSPAHPSTPLQGQGSSTPLNLRHMSIDETREASLTHMDEIWREVEGSSSDVQLQTSLGGSGEEEKEEKKEEMGGGAPVESLKVGGGVAVGAHDVSSSSKESDEPEGVSESAWLPCDAEWSLLQLGPAPKVLSPTDSNGHTQQQGFHLKRPSTEGLPPRALSTPARPLANGSLSAPPTEERPGSRGKTSTSKGIESLLTSLRSLNEKVGTHDEEEEFKMLEQMLQSSTFKKAKEFHDQMRDLLDEESEVPRAAVRRAVPIAQGIRHHLHHHTEPNARVNELRALLRDPHIQAVLFCHDKVSTRDLYIPRTRFHRAAQDPVDLILSASMLHIHPLDHSMDFTLPLPRDVPSSRKENAAIVYLERTNRPLGCTIYNQEDAVFIGKLLRGCDAELSEVLREGDELLEVNGIPVMGRSTDEIVRLMSGEAGSTLALTIIPVHDDNVDLDYEPKYVRPHFNYNGRLDEEIPCKALGLSFQRGDILEISNQDDPNWWQARKVFEDGAESLPGLIPSRHLQQKREALVRSYPLSSAEERYRRKGLKSIFSKKKKKKIYYQQTPHGGLVVGDELATYEDVVKLDPDRDRKRPIVLIGATGVGRRTLVRRLLSADSHFAPVIQHTSRMIRPGEVNGHDYYFVTKEEFERDIHHDCFLEFGELKGHYYGTAFSSVKRILEDGKVPVLEVNPQALKIMRHSGLMPYVVFTSSPRLERLQITRRMGSEKQKRRLVSSGSRVDFEEAQVYTESDLQHLVEESHVIESQYGHYFDWVIVNDDFQVASDMLKEVARRVEEEPQWVPAGWVVDQ